jgi:hypothetical protein
MKAFGAALAAVLIVCGSARASEKPTIVLVHGAFADSSS